MKKIIIIVAFYIGVPAMGFAQQPEENIRQVILELFKAMKESDTATLRSCFSETAFLQTFSRPVNGEQGITTQTVSDFCKAVAQMPPGTADERVVFRQILVDGNMASVWTPFKLYINGQYYSCGVNSIQMVRTNGQWKIQYLIDTRRKDNCVE
ncbi:MAG TPA: nuclear transport factor 2 family protein [Phnomibacter sp.]|nr:nuclear transport factor 2 family protein [Phnomibacter sp.]